MTDDDQLHAADQARLYERNKKRRQRAHKSGIHTLCQPGCHVSPGTSLGTTEDRTETGQAMTGQAPRATDEWADAETRRTPA